MSYEIKLPQFEGPFDLLLFFIERDELDIKDIPIAKITNDFLEYIQHLNTLNIEIASEFILVAATLMRIKAKMLLPRKELDEKGKEIDPREELVQRLMEYKQYKGVVETLKKLETERLKRYKRNFGKEELKIISEKYSTELDMHSITLYKLLKAFEKVLTRLEKQKEEIKHTVIKFPYTIEEQRDYLIKLITEESQASFEKVFSEVKDRVQAVYTFLALLELIQQKVISLQLGIGTNNFWISKEQGYEII